MALTPGARVGVYEVTTQIGEGGMGQVYRARDTKLNRDVALKVLSDSFANDADRFARFTREAQTLASLNHPNIATVYGLEDSGEIRALVMELAEGPTLADRLTQGPIPPSESLSIAKQIAQAVEAAHEQGIIHRDLKPANIKVRPDGTVKVLDFGLAKATETSSASGDLANSPTITSPVMLTRFGMILGTPAYMSPEQARGKAVDRQTDIWAFGCVLYEILVGRAAFAGDTISDTIAKVLERAPDWQAVPASTPVKIRDLLRRCLEKEQARRLHDIADARIELEDALTAQRKRRRVIELPVAVAWPVLALTLLAGALWYAQKSTPSATHELVSVLIADLHNNTDDPTFDHTFEPMLTLALEAAPFVNVFDRADAHKLAHLYNAGGHVDERIARLIAVREGINLIVVGSIEREGGGYSLSAKLVDTAHMIDAPEDAPLKVVTARAAIKADLLNAVASLAAQLRTTLGDTTPAPQLRAADETFTASSFDAIRSYTQAQDFANDDKDEQAAVLFRRAIEQDPSFGRAYAGLALTTELLGRKEESAEHWKKALSLLDRMTEREKYRTLGVYYRRVVHNNDKAIETYKQLVDKYPADATGYNNLAVAYFANRNFQKTFEAGRRALDIAPKRERYQTNYALYAMYAGDFAQAAAQASRIVKEDPGALYAYLPLAVAALDAGRLDAARDAYLRMSKAGTVGASLANMGLADLSIYEGRYDDAETLLKLGLAEDVRTKNATLMATKYLALAEAYIARGKTSLAVDAIRQALAQSQDDTITVPAARLLLRADNEAEPKRIADELLKSLQAESRAYGHVIAGEIASGNKRAVDAIENFRAALNLTDLWLARFSLGVVYVQAGGHDAEALSELEACVRRRGEATAIFLDDLPSFRYLASLPYWLGRAKEGLGQRAAAEENYKKYIALRPDAARDPLTTDARRRLGTP